MEIGRTNRTYIGLMNKYSYELLCWLKDTKMPVIIRSDFLEYREISGIITYVSKPFGDYHQGLIINGSTPVLFDNMLSLKFNGMDTKLMKLILP